MLKLDDMELFQLQFCMQQTKGQMSMGGEIRRHASITKKIEDEMVEAEFAKLLATKEQNSQETKSNQKVSFDPQKATATFDDFQKMDIRLGTILEAEKVKKADKLLKLFLLLFLKQQQRLMLFYPNPYHQQE